MPLPGHEVTEPRSAPAHRDGPQSTRNGLLARVTRSASSNRTNLLALRGVVAAAVVYLCLALAWSVVAPAMWGTDESANAGYAHLLAHGDWPHIETPKPVEVFGMSERMAYDTSIDAARRNTVWTANHPPTYYMPVGLAMRAGTAVAGPEAGLLAARLATALIGMAGVLATGWAATQVLPRRPRAAVLAAATVALVPMLPHYGAQVYSDIALVTFSALAMGTAARVFRLGATTRRMLAVTAACAAMASIKATGAAIGALVGVAVVAYVVVEAVRNNERRWLPRPAVVLAAVVLVGLALTPYLLNIAWYGEPSGTDWLLEKFGRTTDLHPTSAIVWAALGITPAKLLLTEVAGVALDPAPWVTNTLAWSLLGFGTFAALAVLSRLRHGHARTAPWHLWNIGTWGVAVVMVLAIGANWMTRGGLAHARYFFPVVAALAILAAHAVDALPRRMKLLTAFGLMTALVSGNVAIAQAFRDTLAARAQIDVLQYIRPVVDSPGPVVGLCLVAATGAALVVVWTWLQLDVLEDARITLPRVTPPRAAILADERGDLSLRATTTDVNTTRIDTSLR